MVDTNSDPNLVDFPIPSNDDASNVACSNQHSYDSRLVYTLTLMSLNL